MLVVRGDRYRTFQVAVRVIDTVTTASAAGDTIKDTETGLLLPRGAAR